MENQTENNLTLKDHLMNLLAEGEVKKTIQILLDWINKKVKAEEDESEVNYSKLQELVVGLSFRYNSIVKDSILLFFNEQSIQNENNKIVHSLTLCINSLPDVPLSSCTDLITRKVDQEENEDKYEIDFKEWVISRSGGVTIFIFIGAMALLFGAVTVVNSIIDSSEISVANSEDQNTLSPFGYIAHIILTLVAIFVIPYLKSKDSLNELSPSRTFSDSFNKKISDYKVRSKAAIKEFKMCWKWAWIGWFLLYLTLFMLYPNHNIEVLNSFREDFMDKSLYFDVWIDILTNVSSLALIACFSILFFKNKDRDSKHFINPLSIYSAYFIILIVIVELYISIFVFKGVPNLYFKTLFKVLGGLISALSIALLVGRLDSKFIRASVVPIICLFIYSAIQPLIAFFDHDLLSEDGLIFAETIQSFVINYALFAKSLLFIFVAWLIESGKLYKYVIRINRIIDSGEN